MARYRSNTGMSWGFFILTAMGAIVFGLGIILFFAYNWAALPRYAKLALVFSVLIVSHGIALWQRYRGSRQDNLIEGFHLLGTMMFGAGIWLVAQIYNIDEHYPTAFLMWGAGALAFGWALPSVIQGLLAVILISTWGIAETLDFDKVHLLSVALLTAGVLPLAWVQRSRTLLMFGIVSVMGLSLLNIGAHLSPAIVFNLIFASSLLLIAAPYLVTHSEFPDSADVFTATGVALYGTCLLLLTFVTEWGSLGWNLTQQGVEHPAVANVVQWILLGMATLTWIALVTPAVASHLQMRIDWTKRLQHSLILLSLLLPIGLTLGWFDGWANLVSIACNAILAAHCVLLIIRGTDQQLWQQVALGCALLIAQILFRFNDLFHSLLLRSMAFLLIGALLFLIGHQYAKRKLKHQQQSHA